MRRAPHARSISEICRPPFWKDLDTSTLLKCLEAAPPRTSWSDSSDTGMAGLFSGSVGQDIWDAPLDDSGHLQSGPPQPALLPPAASPQPAVGRHRVDHDWFDIDDFLADPALTPGVPLDPCEDLDPLPLDADIACEQDAACGSGGACAFGDVACGRNVSRGRNSSRGGGVSSCTFEDLGEVVDGLEGVLRDLAPDGAPGPDRAADHCVDRPLTSLTSLTGSSLTEPSSGFGTPPDGEKGVLSHRHEAPARVLETHDPRLVPEIQGSMYCGSTHGTCGMPSVPFGPEGRGHPAPLPADPLAQMADPWAQEYIGPVGPAYGGIPPGSLRPCCGPYGPIPHHQPTHRRCLSTSGPGVPNAGLGDQPTWDIEAHRCQFRPDLEARRARFTPGLGAPWPWPFEGEEEEGFHEASFRMGMAAAAAEGRVMDAYAMEAAYHQRWAGLKRRWAQERADLQLLARAKRAAIAPRMGEAAMCGERMLQGGGPGTIMDPRTGRCLKLGPATNSKMKEVEVPTVSQLFADISSSNPTKNWAARDRPVSCAHTAMATCGAAPVHRATQQDGCGDAYAYAPPPPPEPYTPTTRHSPEYCAAAAVSMPGPSTPTHIPASGPPVNPGQHTVNADKPAAGEDPLAEALRSAAQRANAEVSAFGQRGGYVGQGEVGAVGQASLGPETAPTAEGREPARCSGSGPCGVLNAVLQEASAAQTKLPLRLEADFAHKVSGRLEGGPGGLRSQV